MRRKNIRVSYFLLLATTFCLLFLISGNGYANEVTSVIEGHNTCTQCHGRFPGDAGDEITGGKNGRPAVIPENKIDLLCMGCHGPAGIAKTKANIHGRQNYVEKPIGCIGCHDPHNNSTNFLGGQNIKLIGHDGNIITPNSGERAVVFESRGMDAGGSFTNSFADADADRNGIYSGICEVCHTQTKYHRNNPKGNHSHYTGQTCTNCHVHVNQFLPFEEVSGEDLTGDQTPGSGSGTGTPDGSTDPLADLFELSGTILDASGNPLPGITLFLDLNGNGVYDAGEPTAVTDANGYFVFKGIKYKGQAILIMPGSVLDGYEIEITIENNVATITIVAAKPVTIEGYVWRDVNQTGLLESGDSGIPGVTVYLDTNSNGAFDEGEPSIVTELDGFYSFADLPHEPYLVAIDESTIEDGYTLITNNNPMQVAPGPGETFSEADFGYRYWLELDPKKTVMKYPTRVAFAPDGGYYVTDSLVNAVFAFDSAGYLIGQINRVNKPLGIVTDDQGRIYVGNKGRKSVEVYSAGGIRLKVIGKGKLLMPNDLALDNQQNLYVLDSQIKQVKVFNSKGIYTGNIGSAGTGNGKFAFPVAIAINYRVENNVTVGELFVADKKTSLIQVFDLQGNYLRTFGGPFEEIASSGHGMGFYCWANPDDPMCISGWDTNGLFNGIQSLSFDQNGMLHVLDTYIGTVQIFDPATGVHQDTYNALPGATGPNIVIDIDINPEGKVIMTNATSKNVEHIYTLP